MTQTSVVQRLVLPGTGFPVPEVLCVRLGKGGTIDRETERLMLPKGGTVSFDTFYNGLSPEAWKRMTVIDTLAFCLRGHGSFRLEVRLHRVGQPDLLLLGQEVRPESKDGVTTELPWAQIDNGLLYIRLEALTDAVIEGGEFTTRTPAARNVRLGIVITHFNRKPYVLPAIRRIREGLLNSLDYADKISLIVVDNSQILTPEETEGAILLPNRNLGGSGGFARGLLRLSDDGHYTHCLFMDDDASCGIESIRRAFVLQTFARNQELAIAGALLSETDPCLLLEKGATFTRGCARPLHFMRDMSRVDDLLATERTGEPPGYGAWWFFCFDIRKVRAFPFPFFVRGDDILFGLTNDFQIETLNGIACMGEDFRFKENPTTRYLGLRSALAIALMMPDVTRVQIVRMMLGWMLSSLISYNYGSAQAILNAIRDVMKGPSFWLADMDAALARAELAPLNAMEKLAPVSLPADFSVATDERESRLRRLTRIVTLNGFLLPGFLLRDGSPVTDEKSFHGTYSRIFRHRKVLYVCAPAGTGYVAVYDRKRFFRLLAAFLRIFFLFMLRESALRRSYRKALPDMTAKAFWRRIYPGSSA
jgi:GT2 family glycosyltransferase